MNGRMRPLRARCEPCGSSPSSTLGLEVGPQAILPWGMHDPIPRPLTHAGTEPSSHGVSWHGFSCLVTAIPRTAAVAGMEVGPEPSRHAEQGLCVPTRTSPIGSHPSHRALSVLPWDTCLSERVENANRGRSWKPYKNQHEPMDRLGLPPGGGVPCRQCISQCKFTASAHWDETTKNGRPAWGAGQVRRTGCGTGSACFERASGV